MTVSSTTLARVQYNGNGSTTAFSVPFVFSTSADLKVYITVVATGVETLKTLTTDYTVSGGGGSGSPATGTVTFLSAPASGERITILRSVANTQGVDYVENDTFPAQTHEGALDKLTLQVQDLKENLTRAIVFTPGGSTSNISVGQPIANSIIKWDATASILESVSQDIVAANFTLSSTGMLACTALTPRAYAARTLTGGNQISISNGDGVSGNPTISVSTALHNLASVGNGILTRTASDTYTNRTITAGNQITVTNGDGVSGNPTVSVSSTLHNFASNTTTGLTAQTSSGVYSSRTLTGTSNQITVTNGDGVSGNPTISIPSGLVAPGTITSTSHVTINSASELRLADSDSSNYVGFVAPGTVSSNRIWTLPSADGTSGQVLQTNGSGILSFATPAVGGGALEFVSRSYVTGTSTTAINFTGWDYSTYDEYIVKITNLYATGTGSTDQVLMRLYDNSGTLVTSASYEQSAGRFSGTTGTALANATGATSIAINNVESITSMTINIRSSRSAVNGTSAIGEMLGHRDNPAYFIGAFKLQTTGTPPLHITGVSIYVSSGYFNEGGTVTIYRLKNS